MKNHFILPKEEYKRDLDVLKHYVNDAAYYLNKETGKSIEECKEWIKTNIKDGGIPFKNPKVLSLTRVRDDLKVKETLPFSKYVKNVEETNRIISPTMVVYKSRKEKVSLLSDFTEYNVDKRNETKKEKFIAKQNKDEFLTNFKDMEQSSYKVSNNSLSGAHASKSTILRNKSTHSTLTTTCRTLTSYANANNEKFLTGNRHYWSHDVAINNVISITSRCDRVLIAEAISRYNLTIPTADDVVTHIKRSTDLYVKNERKMKYITSLVNKLDDIERVAFMYTGDLYALSKFNDSLVRGFLKKLIHISDEKVDNPDYYIDQMDEGLYNYISLICYKQTTNTSIKALKTKDPEKYMVIAATTKKILETLDEYRVLIQAFWRTNSIPPSVYEIRTIVRKAVITSDTDSTIFTTQDWTKMYVGEIKFDETSMLISHAVTYLVTQTIVHILATVSRGMGVCDRNIFKLEMKNEYYFPIFTLTSMAKHYFALIQAQEGNFYDELDIEIKGVYLKDSNIPKDIMVEFNKELYKLMTDVMKGEKISMVELITKVKNIELDIKERVKRGSGEFFKTSQVKEREAYAKPMSSAYMHYDLWNSVFGDKYGMIEEIPYSASKVSVLIKNKTKLKEWIESIEDKDIAGRLERWCTVNKKLSFSNLLLPKQILSSKGMPIEIQEIIDIRKVVYTAVSPYYLLLESFNYYIKNDKLTTLLSDDA